MIKKGLHMKKKALPILVVCALIVLVVAIMGVSALIRKYTPSKERQDLSTYYDLSENDEVAIVLNNEVIESKGKVIDGHIYLDYNFIHDNLNPRFYWDNNENILLYTTAQNVISAESDSNSYLITKSSVDYGRPVVTATSDSAYVDLDFVNEYSDFIYEYIDEPHRIVITNEWGEYKTATLKKDSFLRVKGGIKSPILADVKKADELTVLEEGDNWTKAMTADGIIGYVKNSTLSSTETKERKSEYTPETFGTHYQGFYHLHGLASGYQPVCQLYHLLGTCRHKGSKCHLPLHRFYLKLTKQWKSCKSRQYGLCQLLPLSGSGGLGIGQQSGKCRC